MAMSFILHSHSCVLMCLQVDRSGGFSGGTKHSTVVMKAEHQGGIWWEKEQLYIHHEKRVYVFALLSPQQLESVTKCHLFTAAGCS